MGVAVQGRAEFRSVEQLQYLLGIGGNVEWKGLYIAEWGMGVGVAANLWRK